MDPELENLARVASGLEAQLEDVINRAAKRLSATESGLDYYQLSIVIARHKLDGYSNRIFKKYQEEQFIKSLKP